MAKYRENKEIMFESIQNSVRSRIASSIHKSSCIFSDVLKLIVRIREVAVKIPFLQIVFNQFSTGLAVVLNNCILVLHLIILCEVRASKTRFCDDDLICYQ